MGKYHLTKSAVRDSLNTVIKSQEEKIKKYCEEITQLKREFDILFMKSPINYVILNESLLITHYNQAFQGLFDAIRENQIPFTDYVEFDYQIPVKRFFELIHATKRSDETVIKMTDGYASYDIKLICRPTEKQEEWFYHCALIDITQEVFALEQVAYLNYHDQLTGLYNRKFFEEELSRLNSRRNMPLGLIMGDVLSLKTVNEMFGFETGNQVLYEIGKRLREKVREDDIVARIGEDMFAILLVRVTNEEIESLTQRLSLCIDAIEINELKANVIWSYSVKENVEDDLNRFMQAAENAVSNKKALFRANQ